MPEKKGEGLTAFWDSEQIFDLFTNLFEFDV
jgi:hypothetical protein